MHSKVETTIAATAIFIGVAVTFALNYSMLFYDADTAWHLATGDLIRQTGSLPVTDPWAYSSAGTPWINLAWLWDVTVSYLTEKLGWWGQIALICCCYGVTMALLYVSCVLRSNNGIASFFSIFLVMISIPFLLRSMWVTNMFLALLYALALHITYRGWSIKWWYVFPALMPLWVNMHGGFIIAFVVLGAFGLEAVRKRNWRHVYHMMAAGILSLLAIGINPYGYSGVLQVVLATFTTPALAYIPEFQASTFSWSFLLTNLYIPVFLFCAIYRQARVSLPEAILAFGLLVMAATSMRYWTFVYLFSCPVLAMYFAEGIRGGTKSGNATVMRMAERVKTFLTRQHPRLTMATCAALAAIFIGFLFTPQAARTFRAEHFEPYKVVRPTLTFLATHYPHTRFMTDPGNGGVFILESHGTFPVFIDGRGESAYPRSVVEDYAKVLMMEEGWEEVFDKYNIGGIVLSNFNKSVMVNQFKVTRGWKLVYEDDVEAVFVRH